LVGVGGKVPSSLTADRIQILYSVDATKEQKQQHEETEESSKSNIIAVVLNKPMGYVSGQAEHGHYPAIQLLTSANLWKEGLSSNDDIQLHQLPRSWKGFAPAGRLDINSTGLLVFSKSGVVAKKLIGKDSVVEKEYLVHVSPANQPTQREIEIDPHFRLPKTTFDLTPLLAGGGTLLEGKGRPPKALKPCVDAKWIKKGEILKMVLTEGRKHHIRRVCRELLGWHVKGLQRIRIGPIRVEKMPEGSWRPLRQEEVENLMSS
jgi:23S rRNA pseudouridine2604 synthase